MRIRTKIEYTYIFTTLRHWLPIDSYMYSPKKLGGGGAWPGPRQKLGGGSAPWPECSYATNSFCNVYLTRVGTMPSRLQMVSSLSLELIISRHVLSDSSQSTIQHISHINLYSECGRKSKPLTHDPERNQDSLTKSESDPEAAQKQKIGYSSKWYDWCLQTGALTVGNVTLN